MQRMLGTLKKWQLYTLTALYIAIAVFLEDHPADVILYFVFEIIIVWSINTIFIVLRSGAINKAVGYFLLQLLMLAIILFFTMFPFTAILLLNKPVLPELNLYYSPKAAAMYEFLDTSSISFSDLKALPTKLFGWWFFPFCFGVIANEIYKHWKRDFDIMAEVSYEMMYSAFMCLGYLIAFLPAFLLHYIIPGSFPFALVIGMRIYTEYALKEE
ncbi:MAG: hypothetical protein AAF518_13555 [Spirochaetota bacterium]